MSKYKETVDKILAINRDDRKKLFGFTTEKEMITAIKDGNTTDDIVRATLKWYEEDYNIPVWTGNILKDTDGNQWIVTCVYTDNSVDLISRTGEIKRKNCGAISNKFEVIGKLDKIKED